MTKMQKVFFWQRIDFLWVSVIFRLTSDRPCETILLHYQRITGESMFHVRDRRTGSLFDPWAYLGPKRRKLLDRSWAGLFRKEILPPLPVEAMTAAFHARLGRPSKDAYTLFGALVFQQLPDTTDEAEGQ